MSTITPPSLPVALALLCPALAYVAYSKYNQAQAAKAAQTAFRGKVVWVTGASSGIGRALALALARGGAKLVLSARREPELRAVAAECALAAAAAGQVGATAAPLNTDAVAKVLPFDLASPPAELLGLGAQAAALWGAPQVDVLVNNGGISSRSPAEDTSLEVDQRVMAVDYFAPVALAKGVLPAMLARRGGHLVVVSSVQGRLALPFRTAYGGAKHALHGYFEALRAEVSGRGVGVTMVLPGYVATSLSLNAVTGSGAAHAQMDAATAEGMAPEELARLILEGVAAKQHEIVACDVKTKAALVARALLPSALAAYMNRRGEKGWQEYKQGR